MLLPIYLAFVANRPIRPEVIQRRLAAMMKYFDLDDRCSHNMLLADSVGLVFIQPKNSGLDIPLYFHDRQRLTSTAYLPFGASHFASRPAIADASYLPAMVDTILADPDRLKCLVPPCALCDLDLASGRLAVCNDIRGYGRLYVHVSDFGTVWTNKLLAAPILAAQPVRTDNSQLAQMAASGMFYLHDTGLADISLARPGSCFTVDINNACITLARASDDACGLEILPNLPANAVVDTAASLQTWFDEYRLFYSGRTKLLLSGGRDSRVVAACALASGIDGGMAGLEIEMCEPPAKDAALARQLLVLAGKKASGYPARTVQRPADILNAYQRVGSLYDYACALVRHSNFSTTCFNYFNTFQQAQANTGLHILSGSAGEIAHNNLYTAQMLAKEKAELDDFDLPFSERRLRLLFRTLTIKAEGVAKPAADMALTRLHEVLCKNDLWPGISGWHRLDLFYFAQFNTQQWEGPNGLYDRKVPLTAYPYMQFGFSQPVEAKLRSGFVRSVIAQVMPEWKDLPFYHELPPVERDDFYASYPTFWEMGRGDELLETFSAFPQLWDYFDKTVIMATFAQISRARDSFTVRDQSLWNRCAQRMLWLAACLAASREVNQLVAGMES